MYGVLLHVHDLVENSFIYKLSDRIQVRFEQIWSSRRGKDIGSLGELLLADRETISFVRYWVAHDRTYGIEFTTSAGTVHGPWGSTPNAAKALQVSHSELMIRII